MTEGPPSEGTVAQRIRQVRHTLAPGEMRVVAALTDSYPTAGLVPIAQLAAEADVSAPTALRLVGKLGFSGYGAFQEALREEVQTRLFSPVAVYPDADESVAEESALSSAATLYTDGLRSTIGGLVVSELQDAVSAVADPANSVMCVGGRFSSVLATQLARYLHMLRTDVIEVPPNSGDQMAAQIDVGTQTVVILFDYRRYQHATIDWGMAAADRGAQLILVTDRYLSPLASYATWVFPTSHAGPGPFDSMTHGFMLVELLVSLVAKELGGPARDRLAGFEELQLAAEEPRRQGPGNRRRG